MSKLEWAKWEQSKIVGVPLLELPKDEEVYGDFRKRFNKWEERAKRRVNIDDQIKLINNAHGIKREITAPYHLWESPEDAREFAKTMGMRGMVLSVTQGTPLYIKNVKEGGFFYEIYDSDPIDFGRWKFIGVLADYIHLGEEHHSRGDHIFRYQFVDSIEEGYKSKLIYAISFYQVAEEIPNK